MLKICKAMVIRHGEVEDETPELNCILRKRPLRGLGDDARHQLVKGDGPSPFTCLASGGDRIGREQIP